MLRAVILTACLGLTGCMMNKYESDPDQRIKQLLNEAEDLKEVEAFWMKDAPPTVRTCRAAADVPDYCGRFEPKRSVAGLTPSEPGPLTVANLHGEALGLFRVEGDELTFVAYVQASDSADLRFRPGQKLAVTLGRAPHCVNYTVKGTEGEVWLVRPKRAEMPTTTGVPVR